jgi:hypothetical protein
MRRIGFVILALAAVWFAVAQPADAGWRHGCCGGAWDYAGGCCGGGCGCLSAGHYTPSYSGCSSCGGGGYFAGYSVGCGCSSCASGYSTCGGCYTVGYGGCSSCGGSTMPTYGQPTTNAPSPPPAPPATPSMPPAAPSK